MYLFMYKLSEQEYYFSVLRWSSAAVTEERKRSLKRLGLEG